MKLASLIDEKIGILKRRGDSEDTCVRERHDRQYDTESSASRSVLVDVLELDGGPDCELGPPSLLDINKEVY